MRRPLAMLSCIALSMLALGASARAQRYINITVRSQVLVGAIDSIRWYDAGITGTARVEYTNGDSTWKLIDTVRLVPGEGSLRWRIPDDTTTRARIRFVVDDTVRASSALFAIRYRLIKRIDLYGPSPGQPLYSGVPTAIRWSLTYADGFTGHVIVDWSSDGGRSWSVIDSVPYRAMFDSLVWVVPTDTTSIGQLRVRTSDGEAVDTSSPNFKVRPGPFVRLISPNGGEVLRIDSMTMVVWESRSVNGHFTIDYSIDGGRYWFSIETRHDAVEGLDSVAWFVPAPPAPGVVVRITHEEDGLADMSDATFRIVDGTSAVPDESPLPTKLDLTDAVLPSTVTSATRR